MTHTTKDIDATIRQTLIDLGYIMPTTDKEIERSLQQYQASQITIPAHLDNVALYLHHNASTAKQTDNSQHKKRTRDCQRLQTDQNRDMYTNTPKPIHVLVDIDRKMGIVDTTTGSAAHPHP